MESQKSVGEIFNQFTKADLFPDNKELQNKRLERIKSLTQPQRELLIEILQKHGRGEDTSSLTTHKEYQALADKLFTAEIIPKAKSSSLLRGIENQLFDKISSSKVLSEGKKALLEREAMRNNKSIMNKVKPQEMKAESGLAQLPEGSIANKDNLFTLNKNLPIIKENKGSFIGMHSIYIAGFDEKLIKGQGRINTDGDKSYHNISATIQYDPDKQQYFLAFPDLGKLGKLGCSNVKLNGEPLTEENNKIFFKDGKNTISFNDKPLFVINLPQK